MTEPLRVSWGVPRGSGLSAQVVSTTAHLLDADDEVQSRAYCGQDIPYAVRPSTPRRSLGVLSRVFPDSPAETARQPTCGRCERVRKARSRG